MAPKTPPKKKDVKEKAKAEEDSENSKPSKKKQKEEKAKKKEKKKAVKEKENTTGDEGSSEEGGGNKSSAKKDKKKKDKKDKKKDKEEEEVEEEAAPRHVFKPLPANWWGANYFVSAGAMTGLEQSEEAKKRQEFTEDSQEALYMRAQGNKVAGRQGLGVRGSKIKISGGDYQGKKIAFGEDEKDEKEEEKGSSGKDSASEEDAAVEGIKWRKLIAKTLKGEESGEMKVKKLQKRVAAAALKQLGGKGVSAERLEGIVLKKLKSCSKFVVEGKVARCC